MSGQRGRRSRSPPQTFTAPSINSGNRAPLRYSASTCNSGRLEAQSKRSRCILRAFINELAQIMRAKFSLASFVHIIFGLITIQLQGRKGYEARCDVTLMYRLRGALLMAYIWRVPPTRATHLDTTSL